MQESCLKSKPISIASIMRNSPDVVGARETTSLRVCYFFLPVLYWRIVTVPGCLHEPERAKGVRTHDCESPTSPPYPPLDNLGRVDPHPAP